MSDHHEVFEQDNGARVMVPRAGSQALEPMYEDLQTSHELLKARSARDAAEARPSWLPRVRLRSRTSRRLPGEPSPWYGVGYGLAAAVVLSVVYNVIVYGVGLDFRILAVACGAGVGLAVQQGTPKRYAATNQLMAATIAYCTIASTYWYFFYEETLYPVSRWVTETQAVAGSFGAVWGWEGSTEAMGVQPAAEVVTPFVAAWKAVLKSLLFPVLMLQYGGVYSAVFGVAGTVAAWKLAEPKKIVV